MSVRAQIRSAAARRRRGSVLVGATAAIVVLMGMASLAYEYGRVQSIKNEMQGCADAVALAAIGAYAESGYNQSTALTTANAYAAANHVDKMSGVNPTIGFVGGTWDRATRTFTVMAGTGTPAVRVTVSRTAAAGNPVPLNFGWIIGRDAVNVQATAIATLIENDAASVTVNATSNPYLGGMPAGHTTPWGDSAANAAACQVTGIDVVPGTWITVTDVGGTSSILPGYVDFAGPEGEATRPLHHGQNYNGADYSIGPENGIADAVMPANALMGVFLTDAAPDATPAPAGCVDWTAPGVKDQPAYTNLEAKAPFLIGDGKTTGGVVQRFRVPPGATRLVLGVWDGVTCNNNAGSLTATFSVKRSVRLVK